MSNDVLICSRDLYVSRKYFSRLCISQFLQQKMFCNLLLRVELKTGLSGCLLIRRSAPQLQAFAKALTSGLTALQEESGRIWESNYEMECLTKELGRGDSPLTLSTLPGLNILQGRRPGNAICFALPKGEREEGSFLFHQTAGLNSKPDLS